MQPELVLNLFGAEVQIRAYTLFTILGALTGTALALPLLKKAGLSARRALGLLTLLAGAFLVGARLFNYLINPAAYGGALKLYSLRLAGFSLYGGIIAILAVILLWTYLARVNVWPLLDALVLPGALAFALARVGCYLNGCCVGKAAAGSFLGANFPLTEQGQELVREILPFLGESITTVSLYPTQLFELALALLGLFPVLWFYFQRRWPAGAAFLLYSVWFSALRLLVLPWRSLSYPGAVTGIFYPLFYSGLILGGLYLLKKLLKDDKLGGAERD